MFIIVLRLIAYCGLVIVLFLAASPHPVLADAPQYKVRPPEKFNCTAARKTARLADAAQTAGDSARNLDLSQQAIEAYELCESPTLDDQAEEVGLMLGVAGAFQDEENTEQAHSVYVNTMVKLVTLCTNASRLSWESHLMMKAYVFEYRRFAEPLGLPALDACDVPFPRPTPSP